MTLEDTKELMTDKNYMTRFFAEYAQTKIRYEKLKHFCDQIEGAMLVSEVGPEHDCPLSLLREQQTAMGEYLHILELRAVIEHIDLSMMEVCNAGL